MEHSEVRKCVGNEQFRVCSGEKNLSLWAECLNVESSIKQIFDHFEIAILGENFEVYVVQGCMILMQSSVDFEHQLTI